MLSRFRLANERHFLRRCFSDKSKKIDEIKANVKQDTQSLEKDEVNQKNSLNKIQSLLKTILEESKVNKVEQSKPKFAQATDVIKKKIRGKLTLSREVSDEEEKNLTQAVTEVAKDLGGDVKQTEAELLSKVLGKVSAPTNLSDLMSGMKIYQGEEPEKIHKRSSRGDQVKQLISRVEQRRKPLKTRFNIHGRETLEPSNDRKGMREHVPIDPFNGELLNIFTLEGSTDYGIKPDVWNNLEQRELKLATSQPPVNYFQKMIGWTEEGKVWKFPIDNEQGLDDEKNVHFSEHIFLESHLEDWPLFKGTVRHFMELVCVGLSKNPYYTVEEKKEHIMWFKEYFDSKSKLLTEIGALDSGKNTDMSASN